MGHTAWAPEEREGRYQAGPKGRSLEVGAQRAPRLIVSLYFLTSIAIFKSPSLPREVREGDGGEFLLLFTSLEKILKTNLLLKSRRVSVSGQHEPSVSAGCHPIRHK